MGGMEGASPNNLNSLDNPWTTLHFRRTYVKLYKYPDYDSDLQGFLLGSKLIITTVNAEGLAIPKDELCISSARHVTVIYKNNHRDNLQ